MRGRLTIVALLLGVAACSDTVIQRPAPPTTRPRVTTQPDTSPPATAEPTGTVPPVTDTSPAAATTTIATAAPPTTAGLATTTTAAAPIGEIVLGLERVAGGLVQPLYLDAPSGDDRLFIVDQPGRVWVVEDGGRLESPFLDINELVNFRGEMGLLGLAFHPGYAGNGRFFVHYTDNDLDTVIAEFSVSAERNIANEQSHRVILRVRQPAGNHNGGMITFGPDGYLYIGLGDGGGSNDQFRNGQDPSTLLGTLLRLDVDGPEPYAIPADNPFAGGQTPSGDTAAPEIWAFGLRNPWRFSFDEASGRIYIGDVGQRRWEEIHVERADAAGLNFGWSTMEGLHCFRPPSDCNQTGLELPALEYGHGPGCSVTGGYVYRGSAIPQLSGHYFYADFCAGRIRSFFYDGAEATDRRDWANQLGRISQLTSFGTDGFGELYVMGADGRVFKIVEV